MGRMKNGIGISLKRMKTIELDENNETARLGPGLKNGEVLRGLEALGKRTGENIIIAGHISTSLPSKQLETAYVLV
jgi:FAD/FMN-containing dehydrogenase